jgi:hypothetical protein
LETLMARGSRSSAARTSFRTRSRSNPAVVFMGIADQIPYSRFALILSNGNAITMHVTKSLMNQDET